MVLYAVAVLTNWSTASSHLSSASPLAATNGNDLLTYYLVRRNYNWAIYHTQQAPARLVSFVDNQPNELAAIARAIKERKIPAHERDGLVARRRD